MTTTTTHPDGSDLAALTAVLATMPPVMVRRIEASGALLDPTTRPQRMAGDVDLQVHLADPGDAPVLAAHWALTAYRSHRSESVVLGGQYLHQSWTGTVPTPAGPMTVRVSSCEYLAPPRAALTTSPHDSAATIAPAAAGKAHL